MKYKQLTLNEIIEKYGDRKDIIILDCELRSVNGKKQNRNWIKYKCLKDNNEDWMSLSNFSRGNGCSVCSNKKIIKNINSIWKLRPDLNKYFLNEYDSFMNGVGATKKVDLICPECKQIKTGCEIRVLNRNGFSCKYCSDGISLPEKFGIYLFKELDVDFETQKTFNWSQRKRYDFYINSKNIVVEVNGRQHYFQSGISRPLQEEQENDKLKYDLAIQNRIKPENYIVVDCRESKFDWLKENYIKSLQHIFDLSNINWEHVWEKCQQNMLIKICNEWNSRTFDDTTSTFSVRFNLSNPTIVKYLKIGTTIGICNYIPTIEKSKVSSRNGKNLRKPVRQYDLNNNIIKDWVSMTEAGIELGLSKNGISLCCMNKKETFGGFKWAFVEN